MQEFILSQASTYGDLTKLIQQWGNPEETGNKLISNALKRYLNDPVSWMEPGFYIRTYNPVPHPAGSTSVYNLDALNLDIKETNWWEAQEHLQMVQFLDLDTEELEHTLDPLPEDYEYEYESIFFVILPVSEGCDKVLNALPEEYKLLRRGKSWQAAIISNKLSRVLERLDQLPFFGYSETIKNFRNK